MSCTPTHVSTAASVLGTTVAMLGIASTSFAQQPGIPVTPPAPYHAPALILAQPGDGGAVPADKPIVVFRFTQGETTDPIDALSFVVAVDGANRTDRFQMTNGEAWGMIDDPSTSSAASHDVRARICSARGTCTTMHAAVSTTATDVLSLSATKLTPSSSKASPTHRARSTIQVLDKVLQAAKVLSRP